MPATEADLFAFLADLGIETRTTRHAPVFTVAESQDARDGLHEGGPTKNLFLKDKNGRLFLVTCRDDRKIRIKDLEKAIGAAKCSFGKPDLLQEALGVTPGSVTVFAIINDREAQRVTLALDAQLLEQEPIHGHPLHNAATTSISRHDLLRFVAACGHTPILVDFDALERAAEA